MMSKPCPTRPELLALLEKARAELEAMPAAQKEAMLRSQRRGYIIGEAQFGSDADEAAYRDAFRRGDKDAVAKLRAAADARKRAAIQWCEDNDI